MNEAIFELIDNRQIRILKPFDVKTDSPLLNELGKREQCIRFQLFCKCGESHLQLIGFTDEETEGLQPPWSIQCPSCKSVHRLFDAKYDGYDAEFNGTDGLDYIEERGADEVPVTWLCPECQSPAHEIGLSLEYAYDIDELQEDEEMLARLPDIFSWISVHTGCASCGHLGGPAASETA